MIDQQTVDALLQHHWITGKRYASVFVHPQFGLPVMLELALLIKRKGYITWITENTVHIDRWSKQDA